MKIKGFIPGLILGVILVIALTYLNTLYQTYLAPIIFSEPVGYLVCGAVPASTSFDNSIITILLLGVIISGLLGGYVVGKLRPSLFAGVIIGTVAWFVSPLAFIAEFCPAQTLSYFQTFGPPSSPVIIILALFAAGLGGYISSKIDKTRKKRSK